MSLVECGLFCYDWLSTVWVDTQLKTCGRRCWRWLSSLEVTIWGCGLCAGTALLFLFLLWFSCCQRCCCYTLLAAAVHMRPACLRHLGGWGGVMTELQWDITIIIVIWLSTSRGEGGGTAGSSWACSNAPAAATWAEPSSTVS